MRKLFFSLLVCLSLFLPSIFAGKAVIAGGAVSWRNDDLFDEFVDMVGGSRGYVGIITAGTTLSIARSTANSIASQLRNRYGIRTVEWLPYHPNNGSTCRSTAWNSKLRSMTGIYFNGGDTGMILNCFLGTSALSVMRSRYRSGDLAVFGSSAGSMVLQDTPVRGSRTSWSSLVNGNDYHFPCDMSHVYEKRQGGFGLFTHGFIDVHFSNRGRSGAFARLVYDLRSYGTVGFGIEEDTAIVMTNENSFKVVGSGGVYIIDVRSASKYSSTTNRNRWAAKDIRVSYLTDGDRYTFSSRAVTYASYKNRLSPTSSALAKTSTNIFGVDTFTSVTSSLFRARRSTSTYGTTSETRPQYRLNFKKESNSVAYSGGLLLSYRDLYMDIYCTRNC